MPGVPRDPQKEVSPLTLGWKRLCPQVQRLETGQDYQLTIDESEMHIFFGTYYISINLCIRGGVRLDSIEPIDFEIPYKYRDSLNTTF